MANKVIVDDDSPEITYSTTPGWNGRGTRADFRSSSKQPISEGATMEFGFEGTSIEVLGVLHTPGWDAGFARMPVVASFSIDGGQEQNFTGPNELAEAQFFVPFFSVSNLSPTQHKLKWTLKNNGSIYLDALIYESIPNSSPLSTTQYVIDGSDSRLQYTGSWSNVNSSQAMGGSLNMAKNQGDSLSFKFNGSAIAMFGRLDAVGQSGPDAPTGTTVISYTVDNNAAEKADYPSPSASDSPQNGAQLFLLNNLDTEHEHQFKLELDNDQPVYVDYFLVSPVGKEIGVKDYVFSSAIQRASATSTSSTTNEPNARLPNAKSPPVGAIVGGVVGGIILLTFIVLLLLFLRRRRLRQTEMDPNQVQNPFTEIMPSQPPLGSKYRRWMSNNRTMDPPPYETGFGVREGPRKPPLRPIQ